jgi:hypothetical protein
MMEANVNEDLKLIQVFLTQGNVPGPSVYEVSQDPDNRLICTCPGFRGRMTCKHVKFVNARIESNNGVYPLEITYRATPEDAIKAQTSNKEFREFVLRFGKIEVV